MSGIFGIAFRKGEGCVQKTQLLSMVQSDETTSIKAPCAVKTYRWCGLGVLGFPGLASGICDRDVNGRNVALAFYGHILNSQDWYRESGSFSSLTEALLNLYIKEGQAFLKRLRGEFVFAVADESKDLFFLTTDRFRIHPLYVYQDHEKLIFSSRLAWILSCPVAPEPTVNPRAVVALVGSSRIPTPETFFSEISKLSAGQVLEVRRGIDYSKEYSYWDMSFSGHQKWAESELIEKVRHCLQSSISLSYQADSNQGGVGAFLSGGIDSSTVTGLLSKLSKGALKAFSIGFQESRYDEMEYAEIAARAFTVEHIQKFLSAGDCFKVIPQIINYMDEPIGNASCIPTYCCALLAKEAGIQFLYAGDGGDEIFAGNERYALNRLFDYYFTVPYWLREHVLSSILEVGNTYVPLALFQRANNFVQKAKTPYPQRLYAYNLYQLVPLQKIYEHAFRESLGSSFHPYGEFHRWYSNAPGTDALGRQLYLDMKLTIMDNDLIKVTRMTEAAGVTVRYPFLDHELVEVASQIPPAMKMKGLKLRSFFKKAYQDLLPSQILSKSKHGFGLPISMWLKSYAPFQELMHDLVLSDQFFQRGYFKRGAIHELVEFHRKDQTGFYGAILWNLMVLELWQRAKCGAVVKA